MPYSGTPSDRFLRPRKRGEPLVMFMTVLALWMGARTATWEKLSLAQRVDDLKTELSGAAPLRARASRIALGVSPIALHVPDVSAAQSRQRAVHRMIPPASASAARPLTGEALQPLALALSDPLSGATGREAMSAATQQVLYMAAMANLPLPSAIQASPRRIRRLVAGRDGMGNIIATPPPLREGGQTAAMAAEGKRPGAPGLRGEAAPRWSGDAWLLMRQGGNSQALAGASAPYGPTYGANQIGAVLRYRLIPGEGHKLTAYARAYGALNGTGEREAAAGLSLRPIPAVPVIALAEIRASQFQSGQTHARPAVTLVTEIPPLVLGRRIEAETYVQAGYVGGAAATPFIDGQIRVEKVIAHGAGPELRMGMGAWGGAQQGANRIDIGPTLRIGLRQGQVGARIAIDYRLRVRGNAMPGSGPALTLSAGF